MFVSASDNSIVFPRFLALRQATVSVFGKDINAQTFDRARFISLLAAELNVPSDSIRVTSVTDLAAQVTRVRALGTTSGVSVTFEVIVASVEVRTPSRSLRSY